MVSIELLEVPREAPLYRGTKAPLSDLTGGLAGRGKLAPHPGNSNCRQKADGEGLSPNLKGTRANEEARCVSSRVVLCGQEGWQMGTIQSDKAEWEGF